MNRAGVAGVPLVLGLFCSLIVTDAALAPPAPAKGAQGAKDPGLAADLVIFRKLVPKLDETVTPAPKVLKGGVAQSNQLQPPPAPPTNVFGFALKAGNNTTKVTYVAGGSSAWLGGLKAGDNIEAAKTYHNGQKAALIVERGGKKYTCLLVLAAPTLDTSWKAQPKLSASAEKSPAQTLADYAIAMVVDNSASMGTKDCAGGISRWQWCHDHISELYGEEHGVLQRNISIVTFDSNFQSRQNCSPGELKSVFEARNPAGETNMAPALAEAFLLVRKPLSYNKPAIVTVISDGRPSDVDNVKQVLIKEINSLAKPDLLSVVFIEVGTPEKYLQELDNDLVKQGAAADCVKVIPFAAASARGLSETLSATLPKPVLKATVTTASAASGTAASTAASTSPGENRAKAAYSSHVYTPSSAPAAATHAPLKATPLVVKAQPPVKAHPTGTSADGAVPAAAPVEVDEKAAVTRNSANKTYK
ncbi:MAG: VWA domain-containing protein [Cyanobacteria bacterium REEB67]|nr:VWA domain-containing protein [Cyanobacteria bacterium REEB67]